MRIGATQPDMRARHRQPNMRINVNACTSDPSGTVRYITDDGVIVYEDGSPVKDWL